MMYSYQCNKCLKETEKDFPMGEAKSNIKCFCGSKAERSYSFGVKIPEPTSIAREGRGQSNE